MKRANARERLKDRVEKACIPQVFESSVSYVRSSSGRKTKGRNSSSLHAERFAVVSFFLSFFVKRYLFAEMKFSSRKHEIRLGLIIGVLLRLIYRYTRITKKKKRVNININ